MRGTERGKETTAPKLPPVRWRPGFNLGGELSWVNYFTSPSVTSGEGSSITVSGKKLEEEEEHT